MTTDSSNPPPPVRDTQTQTMNLPCPQLTSTNYNVWAIKMEAILDAQGVWEAIERPRDTIVDVKIMKRARAYLLHALPEEVVMQVANHRDPAEMWNALKIRYLGADRVQQARYQTLLCDLETLRMKDSETVDGVAGRIAEIATKIRSLGENISDTVLVKKLLNVVPESFLQIVAAIEQFLDLQTMTFEDAIGRLKTYEERIRPRDPQKNQSGQLLLTKNEWQDRQRTDYRQGRRGRGGTSSYQSRGTSSYQSSRGRGRGRNDGRSKTSEGSRQYDKEEKGQYARRDRTNKRCYNCDKYGHFAADCRAPKREDQEVNLAQEQEEPTLLVAMGPILSQAVFLNQENGFTDLFDRKHR